VYHFEQNTFEFSISIISRDQTIYQYTQNRQNHSSFSQPSSALFLTVFVQALLKPLNLQRQRLRVIPTQRQTAPMDPETGMARPLEDIAQLAPLAKAPDISNLVRHGISQHVAGLVSHVSVARGQDDLVGLELAAVFES
jgi:hypothetical protein